MVQGGRTPKERLETEGNRQTVYNMIHKLHDAKLNYLVEEAKVQDIGLDELKEIVKKLKQKGLVYNPRPGYVCVVED